MRRGPFHKCNLVVDNLPGPLMCRKSQNRRRLHRFLVSSRFQFRRSSLQSLGCAYMLRRSLLAELGRYLENVDDTSSCWASVPIPVLVLVPVPEIRRVGVRKEVRRSRRRKGRNHRMPQCLETQLQSRSQCQLETNCRQSQS